MVPPLLSAPSSTMAYLRVHSRAVASCFALLVRSSYAPHNRSIHSQSVSQSAITANHRPGSKDKQNAESAQKILTLAMSGMRGWLGFESTMNDLSDIRSYTDQVVMELVMAMTTGRTMQQNHHTFEMVSPGDHWSFKMSRQIPPLELILQ
jgi:hypothetical protein